MTTVSLHQEFRSGPSARKQIPGAGFGSVLARAADTAVTWLQRERDRRSLQALDDRLLSDIGVSRDEVEREVSKPFWRA